MQTRGIDDSGAFLRPPHIPGHGRRIRRAAMVAAFIPFMGMLCPENDPALGRPEPPTSATVIAGGGLKAYQHAADAYSNDEWNDQAYLRYQQELEEAYYRGLMVPPSQRDPIGPNPAAVPVSSNAIANMPGSPRSKLGRTLQESPRGGALFIGGFDEGAGHVSSAALLYDGQTDSWSRAGDLIHPREQHTATVLADERVLVVGGTDFDSTIFEAAEIFNPATGEFTSAGASQSPHVGHTASLLPDGRVLIVGGVNTLDTSDFAAALAGNEFFDPASSQFSPAPLLAAPRTGHAAVELDDGRVLIVGGFGAGGSVLAAEIYDPAADAFMPTANDPSHARQSGVTATLLTDERVLIAGGLDDNAEPIAATELFDPQSDSFSPGPNLKTPRAGCQAARLPDGSVLIMGGQGIVSDDDGTGLDDLDTSEVFDPAAESMTASSTTMSLPRYQFRAVTIP